MEILLSPITDSNNFFFLFWHYMRSRLEAILSGSHDIYSAPNFHLLIDCRLSVLPGYGVRQDSFVLCLLFIVGARFLLLLSGAATQWNLASIGTDFSKYARCKSIFEV